MKCFSILFGHLWKNIASEEHWLEFEFCEVNNLWFSQPQFLTVKMNIMGVPWVVQRLGLGFFTALACSIPGRETKILPALWSSSPQHSPPPPPKKNYCNQLHWQHFCVKKNAIIVINTNMLNRYTTHEVIYGHYEVNFFHHSYTLHIRKTSFWSSIILRSNNNTIMSE